MLSTTASARGSCSDAPEFLRFCIKSFWRRCYRQGLRQGRGHMLRVEGVGVGTLPVAVRRA
eukprot:118746-Chlamydomonas_euryale.AAC.1